MTGGDALAVIDSALAERFGRRAAAWWTAPSPRARASPSASTTPPPARLCSSTETPGTRWPRRRPRPRPARSPHGSPSPRPSRGRRLWAFATALRGALEDLARLETAATGKPLRVRRGEAGHAAEMGEYYAGWCDKLEGRAIPVPSGHLVYVQREPFGVVLAITPSNAPLFTAAWNAFPALAAGNAVVLKPSEYTLLTSLLFGQLAEAAGLPRSLVQVVCGLGAATGASPVAACQVSEVVFFGVAVTEARVAAACATRTIPCVLELGGRSANIVFADADLETAVQGAQQAIFAGAGQSCVAGSRLPVQRAVHDRFVAALAYGGQVTGSHGWG